MRTIRVEEESNDRTLLWVLAGTTLGVVAGILVAERMSGRKLTARGLLSRARRLAETALASGESLMATAMELREAWGADHDDEPEDELEDEEAPDEVEASDVDDVEDDVEAEDEFEGAEEESDEDDEEAAAALDERVLEAFSNDPVLSQRAVEIESDGGAILLHGRVRSAREVQHAVTIARGVPGVVEVRQRLRVRAHR